MERLPLLNREFSWIEFDRRVLAEARSADVPLLERVKFLSITASNLDEFMMVRAGATHELIANGISEPSADGLSPRQQLKGIRERVRGLLEEMYECFAELVPLLKSEGVRLVSRYADLSPADQSELASFFDDRIAQVLTPLAIDPGHPFPFLASQTLNVAVVLAGAREQDDVAVLRLPQQLPRFMRLGKGQMRFVPIELVVEANVERLFTGLTVRRVVPFRLLRNADLAVDEDGVQDLLKSIESELRRRNRKEPLWLEIAGSDEIVLETLTSELALDRADLFIGPALLKLADLMEIYRTGGKQRLREEPFNPRIQPRLASSEDIFSIIRKGDILLHRPYDSFSSVIELVQSAAEDPGVVAIKTTLYRTDPGSRIVDALVRAAQRGKQVTAVVELQARFDEMKNIRWARRLEEDGVQVVYGLLGFKTHCKVCLVVRREENGLQRYVHLSTGNYNAVTAQLYTDLDLLTANDDFGADASRLFDLITGYSTSSVQEIFERTVAPWRWQRFVVAPIDYHSWVLRMIEREATHARAGRPAAIVAKMNALVDTSVIEALYRASAAGVKIDLLVRGTCCLVPGLEGVSSNIRVLSVVDRFLEHARTFVFRNGGDTEVWLSSGDWMPRNFFSRIEVTFPLLSPALKARVENEVFAVSLEDDTKAWRLQADGTYRRRGGGTRRSQARFIEIARAEAVRVGPFEETVAKPAASRRKAKRHQRKREKK